MKKLGFIIVLIIGCCTSLFLTNEVHAADMQRAYNPNTGEHLYTQNLNEIPFVVSHGWKDEGLAWYAPNSGAPVYRLFNPNNGGDHFYTLNVNERDHLKKVGWKDEGISWYSGGETPIYRLYNPNARSGTHHYTMLTSERYDLKKAGWRYEGIAFYAKKMVPEGAWVKKFEIDLYKGYQVTPKKYAYLGNNLWRVWVNEYDTGEYGFVAVNSKTGYYHG